MNIYTTNIEKYSAAISTADEHLNKLSLLRLIVFATSVILSILFAAQRALAPVILVCALGIVFFSILVKLYKEKELQRKLLLSLKFINEHEVLRSRNELSTFDPGTTYVDDEHPYTSDLDIFGNHSLFQLINRTTTIAGNRILANWLRAPSQNELIIARQKAVNELSSRVQWRQTFQAVGMQFPHTENDLENLLSWINIPANFRLKIPLLLLLIFLSVLSTAALGYFIYGMFVIGDYSSIAPLIIISIVNTLILRTVQPLAQTITTNIRQNIIVLGSVKSLIKSIQTEKFESALLLNHKSKLYSNGNNSAEDLRQLSNILEMFQLKGRKKEFNNFFYSALNTLWFFDFYLISLTEKWKRIHGHKLKDWTLHVGEFEALSSLAGFHYSNPTFTFPKLSEKTFFLHFEMFGHPLIHEKKRICNDLELKGQGSMLMITGSNMAGKSTLLRAIGVNIVLGLTGAPCCATSGVISNIKVFSSMRTRDNLHDGVSTFYAELKRIEQLLNLVQDGSHVFFLLDEIFKGTNSKDRHKGGYSLIRQLHDLNSFGIISTHDLDLAISAESQEFVNNVSLNSSIVDGKLHFDFKLTKGLCKDFNASELMKMSGIKILDVA